MQGIGAMECKDEIEPIPYNMEIYGIQVRITPIYRHADPNHLWRIDKNRCLEILEIFIKKGVYLYEYMDSWSKFDKVNLPLKNAFYSKLNNTHISDSEYEYVQYVWKK
ncbi:3647_t:CDS:2, partial [Rhizophagus irregularis]